MKPIHGDTVSNASCSCTSCSCSSDVDRTSIRRLLAHQGSKIDRLLHEKYIPQRESKLLQKLVKTRVLYEDLRSQLLSNSYNSHKTSEVGIDTEEAEKSDIIALVDLVDKGVILGPKNTKERNECCGCSNYLSKTRLEHMKNGRKSRQIGLNSKSSILSMYKSRDELRLGIKFRTKNIKSDPCTCTFKYEEILKRKSREMLKKVRPEKPSKFDKKIIMNLIDKSCKKYKPEEYRLFKRRQNTPNKKIISVPVNSEETKKSHVMEKSLNCNDLKTNITLSTPGTSYEVNQGIVTENNDKTTTNFEKYKPYKNLAAVIPTRQIDRNAVGNKRFELSQIKTEKPLTILNSSKRPDFRSHKSDKNKFSKLSTQIKVDRTKPNVSKKITNTNQKQMARKLRSGGHALKRCFCTLKLKNMSTSKVSQVSSCIKNAANYKSNALQCYKKKIIEIRNALTSAKYEHILKRLANTSPASQIQCSTVYHKDIIPLSLKMKTPNMEIKKIPCYRVRSTNRGFKQAAFSVKAKNSQQDCKKKCTSKENLQDSLRALKIDIKKLEHFITTPTILNGGRTLVSLDRNIENPKKLTKSVNVSISTEKCFADDYNKILQVALSPKQRFQKSGKDIVTRDTIKKRRHTTIATERPNKKSLKSQLHNMKNSQTLRLSYKRDIPVRTYNPKGTNDNWQLRWEKKCRHSHQTQDCDSNFSVIKEKLWSAYQSYLKKCLLLPKISKTGDYQRNIMRADKYRLHKSPAVVQPLICPLHRQQLDNKTKVKKHKVNKQTETVTTESNCCKSITTSRSLLEKLLNLPHIVASYNQAPESIHKCTTNIKSSITIATSYHAIGRTARAKSKRARCRQKRHDNHRCKTRNRKNKYYLRSERNKNKKASNTFFSYENSLDSEKYRQILASKIYHARRKKNVGNPKIRKKKQQNSVRLVKKYKTAKSSNFSTLEPIQVYTTARSKFTVGKPNQRRHNPRLTQIIQNQIYSKKISEKNGPNCILSTSVTAIESNKTHSYVHGSTNLSLFSLVSKKTLQIRSKLSCSVNYFKIGPSNRPSFPKMLQSKNYTIAESSYGESLSGRSAVYPSQIVNPISMYPRNNGISSIFKRCFCTMNVQVDNNGFRSNLNKLKSYEHDPKYCEPDNDYPDECELNMNNSMRRMSGLSDTDTTPASSSSSQKNEIEVRECQFYEKQSCLPKQRMFKTKTGFRYQILPRKADFKKQSARARSICRFHEKDSTNTSTSIDKKKTRINKYKDNKSKRHTKGSKHIHFQKEETRQHLFRNKRIPGNRNLEANVHECRKSSSFLKRCFCSAKFQGINMNVRPKKRYKAEMLAHRRHQRNFETYKCKAQSISSKTSSISSCATSSNTSRESHQDPSQNEIINKGLSEKKQSYSRAMSNSLSNFDFNIYNNYQQQHLYENICMNADTVQSFRDSMHKVKYSQRIEKKERKNPRVKQISSILRKCFCTSKFDDAKYEPPMPEEEAYSTFKTYNPFSNAGSKRSVMKVYNVRTYPNKLEPFECEPDFCNHLECDPYECLKRIYRRNRTDQASSADIVKTSSAVSMKPARKSRVSEVQFTPPKRKTVVEKVRVCPEPSPVCCSSVGKQAVNLGSSFSFNVEFFKDQPGYASPKAKQVSRASRPPRPPRPTRLPEPKVEKRAPSVPVTKRSVVKQTQRKKALRDSDSQSTTQKSQNTGVGPFLKRCFCTLQFQKKTPKTEPPKTEPPKTEPPKKEPPKKEAPKKEPPKKEPPKPKPPKPPKPEKENISTETQKQKLDNVYMEKGTSTKKKFKYQGRTLDPNECEPGFCVPGECDPTVCLERIKKRNGTEQATCTCPTKTRSVSSTVVIPKSTKPTRPSKAKPPPEKKEVERPPKREVPCVSTTGHRQSVRLASTFSFDIEFYKDVVPYCKPTLKCPKTTITEPPVHATKAVTPPKKPRRDTPVQSKVKTVSIASGPTLKRCFCTLKLQKIGRQQTLDRTVHGTTYKAAATRAKSKPTIKPVAREYGTKTKGKYELEPYECEPGVCIPGECDPYECLARIRARMKDFATETPRPRTKTIISHTVPPKKRKTTQAAAVVKPPRPSRAVENINRQAVRLGSSFSFNVEFYKDRSKVSLPCGEPPCSPSKCKTSSCSTKCPPPPPKLSLGTGSVKPRRETPVQAESVKTESVGSGRGSILKRCFCTLTLLRAEVNTTMNALKSRQIERNEQDKGTITETNNYIPRTALAMDSSVSDISVLSIYSPHENSKLLTENNHERKVVVSRTHVMEAEKQQSSFMSGILSYKTQKKGFNKKLPKEIRIVKNSRFKKGCKILIEPVCKPSSAESSSERLHNKKILQKLQSVLPKAVAAAPVKAKHNKHKPSPSKIMIQIRSSKRQKGKNRKRKQEKKFLTSSIQKKNLRNTKSEGKYFEVYNAVRIKSESQAPNKAFSITNMFYKNQLTKPELGTLTTSVGKNCQKILQSQDSERNKTNKPEMCTSKIAKYIQGNENEPSLFLRPKQYWVQYQVHPKLYKHVDGSKKNILNTTKMETIMSYSPSHFNKSKSKTVFNYEPKNAKDDMLTSASNFSNTRVRRRYSNESYCSRYQNSLQSLAKENYSVVGNMLPSTKPAAAFSNLKRTMLRCLMVFAKKKANKINYNALETAQYVRCNQSKEAALCLKDPKTLKDPKAIKIVSPAKYAYVGKKSSTSRYKETNSTVASNSNITSNTQESKAINRKPFKKQDSSTLLLSSSDKTSGGRYQPSRELIDTKYKSAKTSKMKKSKLFKNIDTDGNIRNESTPKNRTYTAGEPIKNNNPANNDRNVSVANGSTEMSSSSRSDKQTRKMRQHLRHIEQNRLKGNNTSCPCLNYKDKYFSNLDIQFCKIENNLSLQNKCSCKCRNIIRAKESKRDALEEELKSKLKLMQKRRCKACSTKINKDILKLSKKILKVDEQILEAKKMSQEIKKQLLCENILMLNKNAINIKEFGNNELDMKDMIGDNKRDNMLFMTDSLWDIHKVEKAKKHKRSKKNHIEPEPRVIKRGFKHSSNDDSVRNHALINKRKTGSKTLLNDRIDDLIDMKTLMGKSPQQPLRWQKGPTKFCNNIIKAILRTKSCRCVNSLCSRFNPRLTKLSLFSKRFTHIMLFVLSVIVFSPYYIGTRLYRSVLYCYLCTK
ncbi:uncharacterized protein LOC142973232 [Anticarsia gemmatalis]|uniref:uncharacterized protein LOC142973232 n=1 Tax=Anticarsia gemmatalis TaxID=129554 RepID=UPI003F7688F4